MVIGDGTARHGCRTLVRARVSRYLPMVIGDGTARHGCRTLVRARGRRINLRLRLIISTEQQLRVLKPVILLVTGLIVLTSAGLPRRGIRHMAIRAISP